MRDLLDRLRWRIGKCRGMAFQSVHPPYTSVQAPEWLLLRCQRRRWHFGNHRFEQREAS